MGNCMVTPSAMPRGMMVTLCSGSAHRQSRRHERVAGFVVRRIALLRVATNRRLRLRPHQNLVLGRFEVHHGYESAVLPRSVERRLVHQVGQVRARRPGVARASTIRSRSSPKAILRVWTRRIASRP